MLQYSGQEYSIQRFVPYPPVTRGSARRLGSAYPEKLMVSGSWPQVVVVLLGGSFGISLLFWSARVVHNTGLAPRLLPGGLQVKLNCVVVGLNRLKTVDAAGVVLA
jgi:hypothetical protein